ncbi:MAG: hypothetical protein PHV85_00850 [Desulfovibrionaceae bacterium]|nr:hypothetical protein [Desulfovibrionaceae bacterium]
MIRALVLACVAPLFLQGCFLLGTALSLGGAFMSGPAQYVGTAYSIAEFGYQVAVNKKTPAEALKAKFAWLLGEDQDGPASGRVVELAENKPGDAGVPVAGMPEWTGPLTLKKSPRRALSLRGGERPRDYSGLELRQVAQQTPEPLIRRDAGPELRFKAIDRPSLASTTSPGPDWS